jgi:RNA polymerase sigma factor (TIGR02999 family)
MRTDEPIIPRFPHLQKSASSWRWSTISGSHGHPGSDASLDDLIPIVYSELQRMAHRRMARERDDHTLNTTGLVHEAYLRLAADNDVRWTSRAQFYGLAAIVMRRILVDHARAKGAAKRTAPDMHVLDESIIVTPQRAAAIDALDRALDRLSEIDDRQRRVVECRFFAGLSIEETAEALAVSPATVKRDWTVARAWLNRELGSQ